MAWNETAVPDQTGRIVVITGANAGLGLENTRVLAARGARVLMAVRNVDKAEEARARVLAVVPDAALDIVPLDLGDLAAVARAVADITARHRRIDLLINNAGIMAVPEGRTVDGFERQFGVDHLGHFALTAGLLPALLRTPGARVVTVTSTARHLGRPVDPDVPLDAGPYDAWRAYGRAKLANLHFAVGLHERLRAAGATTASLAAHPGLSNTGLQATTVAAGGGGAVGQVSHALARWVGMSAIQGAWPQLRAATDPAARSGELYAPRYGNTGPPVRRPLLGRSRDQRAIDNLWVVSERATGSTLDVSALAAATRT